MVRISGDAFRRHLKALAVAAAALLASACYWTAVTPLMPAAAAETTSPIAPGTYASASGSSMNVGYMSGSVITASSGSTTYRVKFDHMSGGFFLAEAVSSDGNIFYVLVEPTSNGYVDRAMECDDLAVSAGATVLESDSEGRCIFRSYDQLLNATRMVISRIRSDPSYLPGTVYSR